MFQKQFWIVLAAVLLLAVPARTAMAQTGPNDAPVPAGADETYHPGAGAPELNSLTSDTEALMGDGYVTATFKNLSKLYWALAMFDLSDNQAIDNYLFINECELWKKYYNSDLELEDLRAATRASITRDLASFPTKFEIMIPIGLDRYDPGTGRFKLDPQSQFLGAKRLEIHVNEEEAAVCNNKNNAVAKYPKNFVLSLSHPLTLTEVPVSAEIAEAYIEDSSKLAAKYVYRYAISKYGRVAYLRLRVSMTQFRGYKVLMGQPTMADIFGVIDGLELYSDREKSLLMYRQDNNAQAVYTRKKLPVSDAALAAARAEAAKQQATTAAPQTTAVPAAQTAPAAPAAGAAPSVAPAVPVLAQPPASAAPH